MENCKTTVLEVALTLPVLDSYGVRKKEAAERLHVTGLLITWLIENNMCNSAYTFVGTPYLMYAIIIRRETPAIHVFPR